MKKLFTIGILATMTFLAITACASNLRGVDSHMRIYDNLNEEKWKTLCRFQENGLFGFKNANDEVVIDPQYYGAHRFSEGLAFVIGVEGSDYQTGFIDSTGTLIISLPTVSVASVFSEGFATIIKREWDYANEEPLIVDTPGPYIFIDRNGVNVFEQEFGSAYRFIEGFARVTLLNGNDAFINKAGQNAFGMEFLNARDFENGYAMVTLLNGRERQLHSSGRLSARR